MSQAILQGDRRSSAACRVRIAPNFKSIAYERVAHALHAGERRASVCPAIAPQVYNAERYSVDLAPFPRTLAAAAAARALPAVAAAHTEPRPDFA